MFDQIQLPLMDPAWVELSDQLPEGPEWVLLFHPRMHADVDYPGLSVITSNPEYVRINAQKNGYTHWSRIPYPLPLPGGFTYLD